LSWSDLLGVVLAWCRTTILPNYATVASSYQYCAQRFVQVAIPEKSRWLAHFGPAVHFSADAVFRPEPAISQQRGNQPGNVPGRDSASETGFGGWGLPSNAISGQIARRYHVFGRGLNRWDLDFRVFRFPSETYTLWNRDYRRNSKKPAVRPESFQNEIPTGSHPCLVSFESVAAGGELPPSSTLTSWYS